MTNTKEESTKGPTIIAAIRVRGDVGLHPRVRSALKVLKLYKKNCCVVINSSPSLAGTLRTIKDFTTFGELNKDTFLKLLQKRGRLAGDAQLTEGYVKQKTGLDFKQFVDEFFAAKKSLKDIPGLKTYFRLHPPIKGFERGGIKKGYAEGGALDYRGKYINNLIERMI